MLTPYTVRISGAEALSARARIAVELRFIAALQEGLGGPDAVVLAWHEERSAFEKARAAAIVAAWGNAPPAAGATFEIHALQVIDLLAMQALRATDNARKKEASNVLVGSRAPRPENF